jgi:hypothetical protein
VTIASFDPFATFLANAALLSSSNPACVGFLFSGTRDLLNVCSTTALFCVGGLEPGALETGELLFIDVPGVAGSRLWINLLRSPMFSFRGGVGVDGKADCSGACSSSSDESAWKGPFFVFFDGVALAGALGVKGRF